MFEWASATESWSKLADYPFDGPSIAQNLFVTSGGAYYAGAVLKGASHGGLYRSKDGISWAPVVELEGLRLDTLNVESDTLYAAATSQIGRRRDQRIGSVSVIRPGKQPPTTVAI